MNFLKIQSFKQLYNYNLVSNLILKRNFLSSVKNLKDAKINSNVEDENSNNLKQKDETAKININNLESNKKKIDPKNKNLEEKINAVEKPLEKVRLSNNEEKKTLHFRVPPEMTVEKLIKKFEKFDLKKNEIRIPQKNPKKFCKNPNHPKSLPCFVDLSVKHCDAFIKDFDGMRMKNRILKIVESVPKRPFDKMKVYSQPR
ncbi:hypothetical protein HK099_000494 [Clydaea vesicula]|uniref:Uncharacterized protein n=1 Tax=Clydaea vesicula TaxID=447962 RepID=A0AAD5XXH8_9FUNG|nr:hypothetical protein HK099_000494 [Clydaea vesicula]